MKVMEFIVLPTPLVITKLFDLCKGTFLGFISSHAWHCYILVLNFSYVYFFLRIGFKSCFLISNIVFFSD